MQRKISESSSFNLLSVYSTFILGIFNTFIIVRLLAPEEWALIILSLSFVNIAIFFCNLFPPNAQDSIQYYIPRLSMNGENQNTEKRNLLSHVYKIRLFSTSLIFMLFLFIISLVNFRYDLFEVILIMAPIILCNILFNLNSSLLYTFQKFKLRFFVNIFSPLTVTIFNLMIFFLELENPLFLIAYSYLLGAIISCLISIIIIIPLIPHRKIDKNGTLFQKKKFLKLHKEYGIYLILANMFSLLTGLIINIIFLNFGFVEYITYIAICQISVISALLFSSSNPDSYISIFSEINYEKDSKAFKNLFYKLSQLLMLFNCIIVAVMIFYIELYIVVIYSEVYFVILIAVQLFLFTSFSKMIISNFLIISHSTNNTKIDAELAFGEMIILITLTVISLLYFNFYILILFYVLSSFFMTFVMFYLIRKRIELDLKIINLFKPFLIFMVSFFFVFLISYLINIQISEKAYINFILNGTIKFSIFLIIFYILIFFTKLITREDFVQLIEIIPILNSKKKFIQYLVNKIEKFLPKE